MDKEIEVTLLSKEQVLGENRLKIFNRNDFAAPFTDFAILLGGYVSDYYYNNINLLENENRIGYYWTSYNDKIEIKINSEKHIEKSIKKYSIL